MDTEMMIREISAVAEKHKNDFVPTCQTNITAMCMDIIPKLEELKIYEDLDKQGKLVKLPCKIGETVYVLAECGNIPRQLDGTLYNSDGSFGTATGYYCPYEDICPFDGEDFDGCGKYENQTAIFEDTVSSITIEEYAVYVTTEYCGVCSEIGEFVFLTKEEAEAALQKNG